KMVSKRGEGLHVFVDVLEHVEHADEVEPLAREGDVVRATAGAYGESAPGFFGREFSRALVHFDGAHIAMPGQHHQVAAGSGAHLEDAGGAWQRHRPDDAVEDFPAPAEP